MKLEQDKHEVCLCMTLFYMYQEYTTHITF